MALSLASCASIQPPPGGPEDKTPPEIVEISPAPRSINVPRDTRLRFIFSTPLERATFQSAFNITPYVNGRIEYDWSGYDEVTVILPELLRENTTYSVSLSRDLKNRRGNTLDQPYQLIFSTGPQIDTSELAGVVFPSFNTKEAVNMKDIFVFAYNITDRNADTLNYQTTPPDYITQPDDRGVFRFMAMKQSNRIRAFALRDAFRNKLYDHGSDAFAMPTRDIVLDSMVTSGFYLRLADLLDTVRPMLQDAEVLDSLHIRVRFSEGLDTQSLSASYFTIRSPRGDVSVAGVFIQEPEDKGNQVTLTLGTPLTVSTDYTGAANLESVTDLTGNRLIDSFAVAQFSTVETIRGADTLHIETFPFSDSVKEQSQMPDLGVTFSDAVDRTRFESAISLQDSLNREVPLTFLWLDDARLKIRPRDTLAIKHWYTMRINTNGLRSPSQFIASRRDTTIVRRFHTGDRKDNGRLSGVIQIADSLWGRSSSETLVVELIGIG
ncbi:MAG TPA: Ig-like domain-containing protein, partial [Candidatus Kapabacteria bacterium]|nr:Ig-like domain-containing protein [Candidatus Kapabacteria bacterium]